MSKLLVIVGITGAQGSSVYNVFKDEPGWHIRGITRDPSKHQKLGSEGVELVKADLDDQASLERAFSGANAIFAMTDFFQHLFTDPSTMERAQREGKKPGAIAAERDTSQGNNIVRAAAKHVATLDRLVFSTLSDASKWSNGEIQELYHFNSAAETTRYLKTEFPELAKKTSYLQLGNFLTNWKYFNKNMFRKQRDGSVVIRYLMPTGGKAQPFVLGSEDTGHFVRALLLSDKAPAGTTMAGHRGSRMTLEDYAELWGKVNGKKVSYEPMTLAETVAEGMPAWLMEELLAHGQYAASFGFNGDNPAVKSPEECGVDVSKLSSVEDWMRSEDWTPVL